MNSVEAYPLHWPPHRNRTPAHKRSRAAFHRKGEEVKRWADGSTSVWKTKAKLTIADSRDRAIAELGKMGASHIVVSSNLRLRQDGLPMSAQREPDDPGVAVYFQLNKQPHCLSCDCWDRAADNLAAIAKHVDAMRGMDRWGVADIATLFAGFKALPNAIVTPAPMSIDEAISLLSAWADVAVLNRENLKSVVHGCAMKFHPDRNGGKPAPEWNRFQEARALAEEHFG